MKRNYVTLFLLTVDLVSAVFCFWVSYYLRYRTAIFGRVPHPVDFSSIIYGPLLAVGLWTLMLLLFESHGSPSVLNYSLGISSLATPYFFFVTIFLAVFFADRILFSRLQLGVFFGLFYSSLLLIRKLSQHLLFLLRRYGVGLRRVAIVGDSDLGQELAQRIRCHPELHYEVAGFIAPMAGVTTTQDSSQIVVGSGEFIALELASHGVNELVFVIPIRKDSETLDFIAGCQRQGITIKMVPEYYEMHSQQIESLSIDGIPILELRDLSPDPAQRLLKRMMDLTLPVLFSPLLAPFMLVISFLLWLSGVEPILNAEQRAGFAGRVFRMYRFNVDRFLHPQGRQQDWSYHLCKFLYRYSISETPQLWNVLKGDMSLVGPRPENPDRVRHYSAWHKRRLLLMPGMTGLAQVRGLRAADSSDEKTRYDLEYAANLSSFFDIRLLFATLGTLVRRTKPHQVQKPLFLGLKPTGRLNEKRL